MSTFSAEARRVKIRKGVDDADSGKVRNFMDGDSFRPSPITRAKIVLASAIFREPSYYMPGDSAKPAKFTNLNAVLRLDPTFFGEDAAASATLSMRELMEHVIDEGLAYDFRAMLNLAVELRHTYGMRLNPAIIIVRAAVHSARVEFTHDYPNAFQTAVEYVARRPDDITTMVEYYLSSFPERKNGKSKSARLPGILKRAIAHRLPQFDRYQMTKYQDAGIGLLDVINLTHPKPNEIIQELVKNGKLEMPEEKRQWRHVLSGGGTWKDVLDGDYVVTHQDLLYQMRNICTQVDAQRLPDVLERFVAGVSTARLWPSKYWVAWNNVRSSISAELSKQVKFAFERAINDSVMHMPVQTGRVACLVDNSGSARGTTVVDNTALRVCDIGNLSGILNALTCEDGWLGVFGDRLEMIQIPPDANILDTMKRVDEVGAGIGGGTENGVWLFFKQALEEKQWWDTIWIYSDMQAGHGGLYVHHNEVANLVKATGKDRQNKYGGAQYVNVLHLVERYRKEVNPNVNVLTVQIAGYDNSVLPENAYRTAILAGWTGMEPLFARAMIDAWDAQASK